jgi:hypothetical protein
VAQQLVVADRRLIYRPFRWRKIDPRQSIDGAVFFNIIHRRGCWLRCPYQRLGLLLAASTTDDPQEHPELTTRLIRRIQAKERSLEKIRGKRTPENIIAQEQCSIDQALIKYGPVLDEVEKMITRPGGARIYEIDHFLFSFTHPDDA